LRYLTLLLAVSLAGAVVLPAEELSTNRPIQMDAALAAAIRAEVEKARAYMATGEYGKAEASLRLALASTPDADYIRSLRNGLADLFREEGRFTEARPLYTAVLSSPGVRQRQRFDALSGIADLDGLAHKPELASSEWQDAIAAAREMKANGLEADATRGLGMSWLDAGNLTRAEPLLRRALRMLESDPDTTQPQLAAALACLGRCYRMENKLALAEDAFTRSLELHKKSFGEVHPQVAYVMERIAEVHALRGEFSLARDYSTRALAVMKSSCGEESGAVVAALVNRATVEQLAGAPDAAAENYAGALKILEQNPDIKAAHPDLALQIVERYAIVLKAAHRDREAKAAGALAKSFR
jgi:tetratricopeptide (TPR) repeat protein